MDAMQARHVCSLSEQRRGWATSWAYNSRVAVIISIVAVKPMEA